METIFLCGFMGCGKTTVGKLLAEETGRIFADMDAYIEDYEHRTIADISGVGARGGSEAVAERIRRCHRRRGYGRPCQRRGGEAGGEGHLY